MDKIDWKKFAPHLMALVVFIMITFAYFNPLLSGKRIQQGDIIQYKGMASELTKYKEREGVWPKWTNSMFGGMPAYQIKQVSNNNLSLWVNRLFHLFPTPASTMIICMIGFYILLVCMGVNYWLSMVGALCYAFMTYNFLIIEAGHNTKFIAIAYLAPVVAGVLMTYRGKWLSGVVLFTLALALNLNANHPQITYYAFLMLLIYVFIRLGFAVKNGELPNFVKASAFLLVGAILALGMNATRLITTTEYTSYSIRGASELTGEGKSGSGLDKDYALAWSYGKMETMTLLVPRFVGGASGEPLSKDHKLYKAFKRGGESIGPMYWGAMPFTGGPIYHGAIICFLFFLGLLLVKGPLKWWLLAATIMSIVLAWGKNFMPVTGLFFDYFPLYNKFRVVSMILVIAQFTMPFLAILAVQEILNGKIEKKKVQRAILISAGSLAALLLFFVLMGSSIFDFEGPNDARMEQVINELKQDRMSMFSADCLRSLVLILLAAGALWVFTMDKIKAMVAIAIIGVLAVGDLWLVNQRYVNSGSFVRAKKVNKPLAKSEADKKILQDKALHYRVLNLGNPWNDGVTSYHHKSIGGYHGAKMRRYNDMITQHISPGINDLITKLQEKDGPGLYDKWKDAHILNMLNMKYVIHDPSKTPFQNPSAYGNAWFIGNYETVNNANEEIDKLKSINPKETAVIDNKFKAQLPASVSKDASGTIALTKYHPDAMTYESNASSEQLAIFSEIYYPEGWNAYIDGKAVEHFRANYVLRGLKVPSGKHTIEFKFEPSSFSMGEMIALLSSVLTLVMIGGVVYKGRQGAEEPETEEVRS